jgi:hypothetical protein
VLSLLDSLLLSLSAVLWEELLLVLSEVEALDEVLSDLLLSEEDADVLPEEVEELPELELEAGSGLTVMVSALLATAQSLYTTTA